MVVQHNITAMNANRYFGINNKKLSKSLEKLSSGYAINRAGDNAAGLAVSEKMRSQIAGMTQAVKNAQDGISMVQTYEGALTETDSILQRMKTLASQMANGGYDDPVDRTAAQQEFYQLNDELNQIADTDYNGVVVLNGGVMADGLKADANGKFDYSNYIRDGKDIGADSAIFNTLDDSNWTSTEAKAFWEDLGLNEDVESVEVTFTFTGSEWKATDATNGADISKIAVSDTDKDTGTGVGNVNNGGFSFTGETATKKHTVVLDGTSLQAGDTITLKFTNPKSSIVVPEKGAFKENMTVETTEGAFSSDNVTTKWTKGDVKAADMSEEMANAINNLNNVNFELTYGDSTKAGEVTSAKIGDTDITTLGTEQSVTVGDYTYKMTVGTDGSILVKDSTGAKTLGTWTVTSSATKNTGTGKISGGLAIDTAKYDSNALPDISVKSYNVSQSNAFSRSEAQMTYKDNITLQVGARTKDAVNFTFQYNSDAIGDLAADLNCTAKGLGTDKLTIADQESANYAIDKIDQAINKVSLVRGTFGAIQNRLDHKIDNLNVTVENLTDAESRIRDTNMAEEMMNFTKNQILSQASQSMLAQANQLPQSILQLLQ